MAGGTGRGDLVGDVEQPEGSSFSLDHQGDLEAVGVEAPADLTGRRSGGLSRQER
jgi:hypothetical protein